MNMQEHQNTNPATITYQEALGIANSLSPNDALRLAVEILSKLQANVSMSAEPRHLSELKGLGKDAWQTVDVDDYIRQERNSWRG